MKTTRFLAAVLIIGACCSCAYSQPAKDKPTRKPKTVSEALTNIRKLRAKSYHHFLRDASLFFPKLCIDRQWSDVTNLIDKQMCPVVESWENGDYVRRYYLAQSQAFSFKNGHSLDAYIWLSAQNAGRPKLPARPGKINEADILLVAKINAAYEDVIAQRRYPRGSVLDVVLRSKEVKREGLRWPLLKNVFVKYGSIFNRWTKHNPSGFHVTVEFTASLKKEIGGKRMYLYVPSGLDPLKTWDGEVLQEGFAPKDTLGEIRGGGGNEWWHGKPDVVKANQNKYLKSKR